MIQSDNHDWNPQECYSSGNVNAGCLREVAKRSCVNFLDGNMWRLGGFQMWVLYMMHWA